VPFGEGESNLAVLNAFAGLGAGFISFLWRLVRGNAGGDPSKSYFQA
jgi:hypothetical protein